jgi:nicotinamidase-related amidase
MSAAFGKQALLLIDVQQGFTDPCWGKRNNPEVENNIRQLLDAFRAAVAPVIHVQHISTEATSPLRPGQPGVEFIEGLGPKFREKIFQKRVNSAFIGTYLEEFLRMEDIRTLIMVGFTSDHCVSTTARMGANLGFNVSVVSDATVAFERQGANEIFPPDLVHDVSLASLKNEFASIVTSNKIIEAIEKSPLHSFH